MRKLYLWFCLLLAVPLPSSALQKDGIEMPDNDEVAGEQLILNGVGIRRATFLKLHFYVGGLYLRAKLSDRDAVLNDPGPKKLVLRFLKDVDREDVVSDWQEGLADNNDDAERYSREVAELTSGLGDIEEGQELILEFNGDTVSLERTGAAPRQVVNRSFAQAVLRIWFGPNPNDKRLQGGLLGGG